MTINSEEFRRFGIALRKGEFNNLNKNSYEYKQIWQEQLDYCLNGITIGGVKMSGRLYAYINFGTIELLKDNGKGKEVGSPKLRDVEWLVFGYIEEAIAKQKNLMWISGRRGGKSYIGSFLAAYAFTFNQNGKAIIGAFDTTKSDDCANKTYIHLSNMRNTEFYINLIKDNYRDELLGGIRVKDEEGRWVNTNLGRAVSNINFRTSHTAANGKSCDFFYFEEIGMFNNLIEAYNSSVPCWKDGTYSFGFALLAGTGGDMDKGSIDAQKMFDDPDTYDLLAFKDDESDRSTNYYIPPLPYTIGRVGASKSSFFLPGTMVLNDHKDSVGMTNMETATNALLERRERLKRGKDLNSLFKEIQYYPFTIAEAFLIGNSNIFPTALLQERLSLLESSESLKNFGMRGTLSWIENKVEFTVNSLSREVSFPTKNTGNKEGCVVIYEHPYTDPEGLIPNNLYIAGCDPYTQDQADSSPSLGSIMIYKRFVNAKTTSNIVVAEYTGRPLKSDDFYEICRMLLIYYNASCLYENNVPGMKQYFEMKNCLRLLAPQPSIIKDIIKDSTVDRNYGINVSNPIKIYMVNRITTWLLSEYEEGKFFIDRIFSINLLKELIYYNDDDNFDRVISFGLCLIQDDDYHRVKVTETKKKSLFSGMFDRLGYNKSREQLEIERDRVRHY